MNFKNIFKKKDKTIKGKFTAILSISIYTTIIFLSIYYFYSSSVLIRQDRTNEEINYSSIANVIFNTAQEDLTKGNFNELSKISKNLIVNNLVFYTAVVDRHSGKYIWSSLKNLTGTKADIYNPWKNKIFAAGFNTINADNYTERVSSIDNNIVIVGFYDSKSLITLLNVLLKGNVLLSVLFLIFGFLSALILSKIVTKPIKNLTTGAEEFSKGNLKHKIEILTNDETGKLSETFNEMAKKLDNLYSSLEEKVRERTNEIVIKNEELAKAYQELQETQMLLIQNEKMALLGQMSAGLAHELNNPINFINGNLAHLRIYTDDLIKIINSYEEIVNKLSSEDLANINKIKKETDFDFINDDLPALLKSCTDGIERCKQIILDLKNFSRLDEAVLKKIDIHENIESTLNILHSKLKNKVTIHKEFDNIPQLSCYAGQLNQVFMNILDNSAQAIQKTGDIYIKTHFENDNIVIIFEDNGAGIAKESLAKIFNPFFTTKPAGEGTGLGLSISHKIIDKHNGTIEVESEKGKGTKFTIKIPIDWMEKNPKTN